MARFFGEVGYGEAVETPINSGVWINQITEFEYQGDIIRNFIQSQNTGDVNNSIAVANSISIVADDFAVDNFFNIKYVRWMGVLWTVTNVEVRSPRLILNLGSVYNGPTA